ncbi:MAG: DNA polymerase III subunit gamma/tau [Candidatus Marinimicrobia bacterium]|jgi:DNA polymerase-3 subunit gamma/tau|nr:DNA polymerase III subunit gamma/tau [Candidatus Neomarinimicrobiota bacterium]MBT3618280.1 DNA polymerase III subunit gamma/tau [Candidatus Neomarinimicrobiota bacterium]MBT3828225.1 DNA polymerase III subunit gamma/tau [Candidatus Neomarinimicrobiota bacterium]MBT3997142.1 DNA polymerase III subunit gamma/tau [Candidatus Neomarinimicrobiota bacterium]MBT4280608.1 DNA polymerase III subunit gamma/tau [Candidatus Neomarinimicrobiota bacterium]
MSYQVLSLKWRPQSFEDLVGQDHVSTTLINAFKKDRIAQGYIFTGPRGVGKTTSARILAKSLNCPKSKEGVSCNSCTVCTEITDGRNMDVLEIDGASNRGIDEIRNLREVIKYAPVNAPYKIFIIDEVHMLTTQAFNALLRTLEEPPPHGKFMLCTTDIQKVPSTIISRCQRFDFHRISVPVIQDRLSHILKDEKVIVEADALKEIARKADGSMRDALSILDQVIAYGGDVISMEEVSKVLGLIPHELYFQYTQYLREKNSEDLIALLREIRSFGTPLEDIVFGLTHHIRNLLFASVNKGLDALELNEDIRESYLKEITFWDNRDLLRIGNVISDFSKEIKRSEQPQLLMEMMSLKLLEMDQTQSIENLINNGPVSGGLPKKYPAREDNSNPQSNPEVKPKGAAVLSQPSVSEKKVEPKEVPIIERTAPESEPNGLSNGINLGAIHNHWSQFLTTLSSKRPSLGSILEHSIPQDVQGSKLTISIPDTSKFSVNSLKKNREDIETIIESVVGKVLRLNYTIDKDIKPKIDPDQLNDEAKSVNGEDPILEKMIERFDGEIMR